MGSLLYRHGDHEDWAEIPETSYRDEAELQRLLTQTPSLIPIDDIGGNLHGPLMTVSREASLASGNIDVLCVDQRGRPVVIEAKLRRNPEIRREVISQALSYAAHLEGMSLDEFNESVVRPWVENTTDSVDANDLQESLAALGYDVPAGIEEGITRHLAMGDFAILIVVDEPHKQLRRTVSYVNNHSDFDVYLVEVGYYRSDDGREVISPRVLDASVRKPTASRASAPTFTEIIETAPEYVQEVDSRLLQLADELNLNVRMTRATRQLRTADGIHLLGFPPTFEQVGLTLATMRKVGMHLEANEIHEALQTISSRDVTDLEPSVSCTDLLENWEVFKTEILPRYIECRLESKRRESQSG